MFRSAAWSRVTHRTTSARIHHELAQAADLLQAPRVLMLWEEPEAPWLHLAIWSQKGFDLHHEPPETFAWIIAEPLRKHSFLCADVRAMLPEVTYTSPTGPHSWSGVPLHPVIQTRFAVGSMLSAGLHATTFAGRLFFLDICELIADDLPLAELAARQLVAHLDQDDLSGPEQQAAVIEERRRFGRTLHDGVLQSLTGISLQLTEVQRLLEENPPIARQHLGEIARLIVDEQRDLRFLIGDMKPAGQDAIDADLCLPTRLQTMSQQIEHQWGLSIKLHLKLPERPIPPALAYEIYYVVHEALANAARHAHASAAHVELAIQNNQVHIIVCDNGHGFPFHGRYHLDTLTNLQCGPTMLKERVAALGGSLTLASNKSGARLDIRLPLLWPEKSHSVPTRPRQRATLPRL